MKSHYGYGGDSYGKSYSTYSSYKPSSYRHKRSVTPKEINQSMREAQEIRQAQRDSQSCTTVLGSLCVFPFIYKGRTFVRCTEFEEPFAWCATRVASNGEMEN